MRVVKRAVLFALCEKHADSRDWIENWLNDVEASNWRTPQDVKSRYPAASFLANNLVIFNVRGNRYRLETQVAYQNGVVLVIWAGTHAEYTKRHG